MMTIPNISGARLESLCEFLSAAGLTYEGGAEYTVLLLDDETDAVVGTGSLCGSVLKYIAVSEAMQGEGGAASIVSELVRHAYTCSFSLIKSSHSFETQRATAHAPFFSSSTSSILLAM